MYKYNNRNTFFYNNNFRITTFQHENLTLKQQLETLQQMLSDRSGEDAHEKFTNMLASLKTENEKVNFILCVVCKDIIVKHDTG